MPRRADALSNQRVPIIRSVQRPEELACGASARSKRGAELVLEASKEPMRSAQWLDNRARYYDYGRVSRRYKGGVPNNKYGMGTSTNRSSSNDEHSGHPRGRHERAGPAPSYDHREGLGTNRWMPCRVEQRER